jgi:type II secretory pathway component PulF
VNSSSKPSGRTRLGAVTRQLRKNHLRRAMLYQLLRDYVANKSSLTETFETLARRKREDRDPMHLVFDALVHLVRDRNIDIFDALRRILPADEVLLIESYPSHRMSLGFEQARQAAIQRQEIARTLRSTLGLPLMSLTIGFGALFVLLKEQVPLFRSILPIEQWPSSARGLLWLHTAFVEYLGVTVGLLVVLVLWVSLYSLRQPAGGHRRLVDWMPPWSLQRGLQAATFLNALGALVSERVSIVLAVERIQRVSPPYLRSQLAIVRRRLDDNQPPGRALSVDLFDKDTAGYVRDFIEQPSFSTTMISLAGEQHKALRQRISGFSVMVGVTIILLVNGINGYVAFTGFQLNQQVKEFYSN